MAVSITISLIPKNSDFYESNSLEKHSLLIDTL